MRTSTIRIAAMLIAVGTLITSRAVQTQQSNQPRAPRMFKDSRQTLAIARAQGRTHITLVVATVMGRVEAAAQEARRLGGDVRHRDDEVGYLRVRIPIDKAVEFTESASVEAAAADQDDSLPSRLGSGNELLQSEQWPPAPGDYPLRNAYSAIDDLAASDFMRNRTFDGRGVTIALLDGNIDPLLPEFQTAYMLDGTRTSKFADYLNVTDPRDDAELNPQWVDMHAEVDGSTGRVTHQGKVFTVPKPGRYRIGLFDERRFNDPANAAYIDQDVDRSGNPKGDDGLFGVLWDERTNDVWVDTNRDLNFSDEKPMTDYIKRHDFGVFGHDDPNTPIRESIAFAVQTDLANKFVSINLGIYQHASEIMGSVVGNRDPNGRVQGVAPGARVVSMFYGVGILHGAIEGMIRAFRHPDVDLIVFEQSVNMASVPYLIADGRHPISVIAQRLTEQYQKLMFVPCGNAPGFGLASEDGVATGVVCVGGYQSRSSYLLTTGATLPDVDNLHWGALSHGPSGNGALKPDLLAPSGQMGTDVGYRKGPSSKGLYQLPPGYSVSGGTSTATPTAAASAALVVSAAKQHGMKYDAARLKAALMGSARYIPKYAAHEQGAGLIQVGAAFALLEKLQPVQLIQVESRAPVQTTLSPVTKTPNEGAGIYEREGWKAGDRGERTIILTRTSGGAEPLTMTLKWLGNDGTFSGPPSVSLPLNQPVKVSVTIAPQGAGAHSAILLLEHASLPVPVHRVLCTVVASTALTSDAKFSFTTTVEVPKAADRSVFVSVPPGTSALSFSGSTPDGPVRLTAVSPDRDYLYACVYPPTSAPCAVGRPLPGVWEINLSNTDMTYDEAASRPIKPKVVKLAVAALGADIEASPAPGWIKPDGTVSFPVHLTSRLAALSTAAASSVALGSAFQSSRTIMQGEQQIFSVDVPKGATSLIARVQAANPRADLDVYLLDCTGLKSSPVAAPADRMNGGKTPPMPTVPCVPRAKAAGVDSGGEVEVSDPATGTWTIVVDAYSVLGGSVSYEYMDAFTHPRFGTLSVSDIADNRASGSTWTAGAHAWAANLPEAPRKLYGRITVTSREAMGSALGQRQWPVPLGSTDLFLVNR